MDLLKNGFDLHFTCKVTGFRTNGSFSSRRWKLHFCDQKTNLISIKLTSVKITVSKWVSSKCFNTGKIKLKLLCLKKKGSAFKTGSIYNCTMKDKTMHSMIFGLLLWGWWSNTTSRAQVSLTRCASAQYKPLFMVCKLHPYVEKHSFTKNIVACFLVH